MDHFVLGVVALLHMPVVGYPLYLLGVVAATIFPRREGMDRADPYVLLCGLGTMASYILYATSISVCTITRHINQGNVVAVLWGLVLLVPAFLFLALFLREFVQGCKMLEMPKRHKRGCGEP